MHADYISSRSTIVDMDRWPNSSYPVPPGVFLNVVIITGDSDPPAPIRRLVPLENPSTFKCLHTTCIANIVHHHASMYHTSLVS